MEALRQVLLILHIAAGSIALLTAVLALVTAKGGANHIRTGRVYALAMTGVFLTALPLAALGADTFLLFIAVFSFYMVFAGWRFARNRRGRAQPVDWLAVTAMSLTGLGMAGYAVILAAAGDSQWITMTLFGFIALGLATVDGLFYRRQRPPGPRRIARHLTNMLAGTIATITAVLVVNVQLAAAPWLPWILPTIVITPLIVWWNQRVLRRRSVQDTPH